MGRFSDWLLGPPRPAVEAAAATVALARPGPRYAVGPHAIGWGGPLEPFTWPDAPPWFDRDVAVSLPALGRARNLICSTVGLLPFTAWAVSYDQVPAVSRQLPGPGWFRRPDPDRTRQWLLAWTTDDLYFYGVAYWLVTGRYADTFPSSFARIPPGALTYESGGWVLTDDAGKRRSVSPRDVVEFASPDDGVLAKGWRAISTALKLDEAADRFAAAEVPAGVLEEQDLGQEDISSTELAEACLRFTEARRTNTTAGTNRYLKYVPTAVDASTMQLVEGRTYSALELARLGDVPPYLVGAPAGTGMTYLNTETARQDLIDFGCQPYITCIEQTLSGPNVMPRGQSVRLDLNVYLRNPWTTGAEPSPNDMQIQDPGADVAEEAVP